MAKVNPLELLVILRFLMGLFGKKKKARKGAAQTLFDLASEQLVEWPEARAELEQAAEQYPALGRLRARGDQAYRVFKGRDPV